MLAAFIFVVAAGGIHYASPVRTTRILVLAMAKTEETYIEALETGWLSPSDSHIAERLSTLQLKVSIIREASLRSSLSWCTALREFLKGQTFTVLRCVWEVHDLQMHIEILNELQLRREIMSPLRTLTLRRRTISHSLGRMSTRRFEYL
ncbi:hypothetical protein B0H19DRAFT_516168 [Mycena capillaripes]|nr:hypothetical protein B0H19DRAFT_516168 [Mycena capillaripes]